MYEGWLTNWKEDFNILIGELNESFSKIHQKYLKDENSKFQQTLQTKFGPKDIEMYNVFKILSSSIANDFAETSTLLQDCFDEKIGWALRNFVLISFINRMVQAYAVLEFLIDNAENDKLDKIKLEQFEVVVDKFFDKMDNFDFASIRRAGSVISNPFNHFCPSYNYSKSLNFYSPEFFITGSKFVKDSIKINKFDVNSEQKFESIDNFDSQVMSTFKTGINVLKQLEVFLSKYK